MKMEALRALYESLGFRNVQSYVNSGNVVFTTRSVALPRLEQKIEESIEQKFGFRPPVIVRTPDDLRDVIARNPFSGRSDIEPSKLLVMFLRSDPGPEVRDRVMQIDAAPEELRMDGRELYIYYPNGMARPKLSASAVDRALKVPGTGRNWNTVLKLLEIAGKTPA